MQLRRMLAQHVQALNEFDPQHQEKERKKEKRKGNRDMNKLSKSTETKEKQNETKRKAKECYLPACFRIIYNIHVQF